MYAYCFVILRIYNQYTFGIEFMVVQKRFYQRLCTTISGPMIHLFNPPGYYNVFKIIIDLLIRVTQQLRTVFVLFENVTLRSRFSIAVCNYFLTSYEG